MKAALTRIFLTTVLPCMALAAGGAFGQAGGLQISPLVVEVPPSSNTATYTLRNHTGASIGVQVQAFDWEQKGEEDSLLPTKSLLVVPKIVNIPPGKSQLVRVALTGPRPSQELNYRLHFQELPSQTSEGVVRVQTLLKINVPLFFTAQDSRRTYSASLTTVDGDPFVVITNTGSRYLRFSRLELLQSNGDVAAVNDGLIYVLPGASRSWRLTSTQRGFIVDSDTQYRLQVTSDGQREEHLLTLH